MECGKVYGINRKKLLELYTIETAEYILEEPLKLNDELKKEGATFLLSLPKRIITKPYRIIKEFIELAKED
ncbi:MAG: hypothetical protein UMV23_03665 [Halanaerobium sp.]|nr:hypothetical protein [Halanaerobium sp.]